MTVDTISKVKGAQKRLIKNVDPSWVGLTSILCQGDLKSTQKNVFMPNPNVTIQLVFTFCLMRTVWTCKLTIPATFEIEVSDQCPFTLVRFATCSTLECWETWTSVNLTKSLVPGNICQIKMTIVYKCTLYFAQITHAILSGQPTLH